MFQITYCLKLKYTFKYILFENRVKCDSDAKLWYAA